MNGIIKWEGLPYVVASLTLLIVGPLFREFGSEGSRCLKILMGLLLGGLGIGVFVLSHFLAKNWDRQG